MTPDGKSITEAGVVKQELLDKIFDGLHKAVGICGHCGKKECAGKASNSVLPASIPTHILLKVLDGVESHGEK